jgi:hypothetical protein
MKARDVDDRGAIAELLVRDPRASTPAPHHRAGAPELLVRHARKQVVFHLEVQADEKPRDPPREHEVARGLELMAPEFFLPRGLREDRQAAAPELRAQLADFWAMRQHENNVALAEIKGGM